MMMSTQTTSLHPKGRKRNRPRGQTSILHSPKKEKKKQEIYLIAYLKNINLYRNSLIFNLLNLSMKEWNEKELLIDAGQQT